eukprot:15338953-Ditylum_brightwellii.AAC.1
MNNVPEIRYYNPNDPTPPQLTEEEEEDDDDEQQEEEYDTEEDSDNEEPKDTSDEQETITPPLQPTSMNIHLPIPYINTMEQYDTFQV